MNSFRRPGSQANHVIISILEKSKLQDDLVLENVKGICAVINEEGSIYKANHELADLLETPIISIRQHSVKKLFTQTTWRKFVSQMKIGNPELPDKQTSFEVSTDALDADKQKHFLFDIYHYGQYKNLEMNFYFILGTDITSLRNTESKLKDQIEENKKLVRIITHDLASPLTVIDFLARNLSRDNVDLKVVQRKLMRSSETIKEILFSVRNLQAIIDGVKKINLSVHSIDQLIAETLVLFDEKLTEKNIKIEYELSYLNVLVEGKTLRNQVLSNLISNAIKFTFPNSKILISIEETEVCAIVKIRDFGMGIKAESVPKLFVIAQNCSTPGTSGEKGTGYGLPICKSILEIMGGGISVESKHIDEYPTDHGTTFSVSIQKVKAAKSA
jgi:signal transduction histidine kinase